MPETVDTAPHSETSEASGIFGSICCIQVDLRYRVAKEKFNVPQFLEFFGKDREDGGGATCRTLEPDRLDYHIHFWWKFTTSDLMLFVSFHQGTLSEEDHEREPYAETFMAWLGSFFESDSAHCDIHVEFDYPSGTRQSRFPLSLKFNFAEDLEAEINGMKMNFSRSHDGIDSAVVTQGKKWLNVEMLGSVRTKFVEFDLSSEISRFSAFALRMTEIRETSK